MGTKWWAMNRLSLCERTIKAQHNHDSFSFLSPKYLLFVLVLKLEENSMHGSKILKREEKIGSRCTQLRTIRCGIWTVKINWDFWGSQGMRILVDTTLTTSNSLTAEPQKHPNSQYALPCLCLYKWSVRIFNQLLLLISFAPFVLVLLFAIVVLLVWKLFKAPFFSI
jgi:hypothetical protein